MPSLRNRALGQAEPSLTELIPPSMRPYMVLRTPMGTAVVDPLAASQDSRTQQIMQALGITMEMRFGEVPESIMQEPQLSSTLNTLGLIAVGAGVLFLVTRK